MHGRQRLVGSLESSDITIVPGVYDGISARQVEASGFETGFLSGAGVSNSRLAQPDVGVLNLTEIAAQTRAITDAVDIPIWVDADTGYGNAVNVYNTIRTLDTAGAAAIMIEDQQWPKRCGHMDGKSVIPYDEAVAKIDAAVAAIDDRHSDTLVMARTDAAGTHGTAEAIDRLNAFAAHGADIVFADALLSESEIRRVCHGVDGAFVCVNMGFGIRDRPTTPLISAPALENLGVDAVIYPRLITAAATKGMKQALAALEETVRTRESPDDADLVVDWDYYMDLVGKPAFETLEERFAHESGD